MISSHFRSEKNIERAVFLYYACAVRHGHFKRISRIDNDLPLLTKIYNTLTKKYRKDSIYMFPHHRNFAEKINKFKPKLFCINDNENTTDEDRIAMKEFLKSYFPEKSSFEK